jgi:hypothetical protein
MRDRHFRDVGVLSGCVGLLALAVWGGACGGSSDSQVTQPVASSGGSGAGSGGSSGSSGSAGSGGSSGSNGASGSGGSSGAGTSGGSSGSGSSTSGSGGSSGGSSSTSGGSPGSSGSGGCQPASSLTLAANITIAVTWPGTTAGNSGSGDVHLWLLSKFAANGNDFTGTNQTCALSLPDLALNALGSVAAGGGKVQIQIPASVWAKPSMPTFPATGSVGGWDLGASITINQVLALVGLSLPAGTDPLGFAWPASSWSFPSGTTFPDHDGDMNPGITASPLSGGGYVLPPTAVGLIGSAPAADEVYIASRTTIALSGQWTSCTDQSGTATVSQFDNHVVGCHIKGGSTCTTNAANTQADFLDQNRTVYTPGAATFVGKTLPDTATCADVIAALP